MYNKENYYFVWLSSINIKPVTKVKLLEQFKTPKIIFESTKEELKKNLDCEKLKINIKNKELLIEKIIDKKVKENVTKNIEKMNKLGIGIITYLDEEYPQNLKDIYDFPICLYFIGNKKILQNNKKIAMIGCREYSMYGKNTALMFSEQLAKNNFTIVSGCARGIDSFAHTGTLKYKEKTIAVLGNSIEYVYPPENKILEEKIIKSGGLILSEYIIGTKPSKYTFPARNRIISALSDGVLVIEAKEKSGTIITVDFALEQGKNIYAVPGNITSKNSEGTNDLIKNGAKIITKIDDILEDF